MIFNFKPRFIIFASLGAALCIAAAVLIGTAVVNKKTTTTHSLLSRYFKAMAADDSTAAAELLSASFTSDLGLGKIKKGSYELYVFGEAREGVIRFMLIAPDEKGKKEALIAEMRYSKSTWSSQIESFKAIERAKKLEE